MLHSRDRRIAESIRQSLTQVFQGEVQDPRLAPIVTITQVDVTKDLRHATVYYSQMPDDEESLDDMEALLEDSNGFLRSCVARDVNIKFAPSLSFRYDPGPKNFDRINRILKDVQPPKEEDEES